MNAGQSGDVARALRDEQVAWRRCVAEVLDEQETPDLEPLPHA